MDATICNWRRSPRVPGPASSQGVVIGGQSGTAVAFLLDGHDNNSQQISTGHSGQKEIVKPSVDAIQEFKVVTNSYSAEYGRSSSGVVSVSLKSGTNSLNGSLYEFFRDDALNATNYFATTKPVDTRHQFGGAVGFPIVRNKTFFFGDSETGRIRRETTTLSTLPSATARGGQFSRTIIDPLTRLPFPGNSDSGVARRCLWPLRILGYVPLPQTGAATNNFTYNSPSDQDQQTWDVRIDHVFSPKHNAYVRVSSQRLENKPNSPLPPDSQRQLRGLGRERHLRQQEHRRRPQRGLVAQRHRVDPRGIQPHRLGRDRAAAGSARRSASRASTPAIPGFSQIAITGYRTLGVSNVPNADDSKNLQVSGDMSLTKGTHTIKTGVQHYQLGIDFLSSQRSSGIFNFNGQYTGDPFADYLLGYGSSASLSKYAKLNFRTPYTHFFVQDDWRTSERLTLNLGLRYELNYPSVDQNDAIANFDLDTDPLNPRIVLAGSEGDDRAARALVATNYRQFAPRAGFAYLLPGDKTVVRGGAGIFYGNMITVGGMSSLEINPPNHVRIAQTTDRTIPSIFLSQGFAADALSVCERARRQSGVVGSQRQAADGVPVEREHAARAARPGRCRGRLLLQPSGQQLAIDRRQPGASGSGKPESAASLPDDRGTADGRRHHARQRHADSEGRLEPVPRAPDEVREALLERHLAACGVHVVEDSRPRRRLPGLHQHRR